MLSFTSNHVRDVESRFAELRNWIMVHGAFSIALLLMIRTSMRPHEILTATIILFAVLSALAYVLFHRAAVAVARAGGSEASSVPSCTGFQQPPAL